MKKILLIAYYFPPCGGAAVQRWLRLLPLLVESGFDVTVLTTQDGDYIIKDESLLNKIPANVKVFRTFTPTMSKLWKTINSDGTSLPYGSLSTTKSMSVSKRLMFWIRLNLIIPDVRIIWNPFAKRKAIKLCKENDYDWIITTGPPHSTHLIGLYLKKRFHIKWLADFRDPWTQIIYLQIEKQNAAIKLVNKILEKKVVKNADVNLIVSKSIAKQLPDGNKVVFYNGFDLEQFQHIDYVSTDKFRIKYIGQITEGQDIYSLLDFISKHIDNQGIKDIEFSFIGTRSLKPMDYSIPIKMIDYLPHDKAIAEMINCEILILMINNYPNNQGMLTTRLFEYIAAKTPILCFGPLDGEAASIINDSDAGYVSDNQNEDVWNFIHTGYSNWKNSINQRNTHDVSQWSVQKQSQRLIDILNQ